MTIQDISLRKLSGSKGDKPKNTSDNLFSTDVVEVLLGISEGPIKGLAEGAKSFIVGETTLQDPNGENNFEDFELIHHKGGELGEDIQSRMGGFGASTTVSTNLATNVPVIRSGQHTQIDYLDVRFAINQLVKSTEKGTFNHTGRWKVEFKPVSSDIWIPVNTPQLNPRPSQVLGNFTDIFYGLPGSNAKVNTATGDRPCYVTATEPISTASAGIWFNIANSYEPKVLTDKKWVSPAGAIFANGTWTWTEKTAKKAHIGAKPTGDFKQGDYWINVEDNRAFLYNGSTWINAGSSLTPGEFGSNGTGGSIDIKYGEIILTGKTSSVFPKEFRIPVARIDEPYMIRVTKTSPNNTSELFFDITWESFQEVTSKDYKFPGLATTQLVARASEQFSSIPDFSGIYDGRIVRVPSNYDPETRTYAGVWDGTWKLAYTNNPAFVAFDIVMNDRYGMNAYYPIVLNKMDVYEAGQWCDVRTASGKPRFTYNGLFSDPRGGRDALNYICGIFAGRFFDDGNGTGVIRIDKDEAAGVIFTPENVIDGIFTYSFTEISTRHNDITVAFTNPDINWQEDRRRVADQPHIDQYGRIPHNFIAVGCTDAEEAVRRARYHLLTGLKETMMVSFKTNRQGLYISPYGTILISDPDMDLGLSGRVQSISGKRTIHLRDAIHLEPGFAYSIKFSLISEATKDFILESRDLKPNSQGSLLTLEVTQDLPDLPDDCVFTIEQTNGDAAPMAFRVTFIDEVDGDPDSVEIQAVQMYRAKWLYIDGHVESLDELDQYLIESRKKPEPVANLRVEAVKRMGGSRPITTITLNWDKSPTKTVTRYRIEGSRNNGPMSTLAETTLNQFEWDDIPAGEYLFQISAIDVNGFSSKPVMIEHRLIGDYIEVDPVAGLRMVDEPSSTIFESRSPVFKWDRNTSETFEEYVLQVCTPGGVLIREQVLDEPTFTFEYSINAATNNGAPRRSFMIRVASKDQFGFLSTFEQLIVNNPSPVAPVTQSVSLRRGVAVVKYTPPVDRDFVGVVVYASNQQGFTPTANNIVYKGPNTDVPLDLPVDKKAYLRIAFYDFFGDADLNLGLEMSIDVPDPDKVDVIPPGKPVLFSMYPGVGFATAEWVNPSDDDLDLVEVYYSLTPNLSQARFGAVSKGESINVMGLDHGVDYYFWARAVDTTGNRSDFAGPQTTRVFKIGTVAIENGIITKDKLAAGSVTADKLAGRVVTAEKISVDSLAAISANLGNVDIDAARIKSGTLDIAHIGDLTVDTIKIKNGAITTQIYTQEESSGNVTSNPGVWNDVLNLTISNSEGYPVQIAYTCAAGGGGPYSFRILRDGVSICEGGRTPVDISDPDRAARLVIFDVGHPIPSGAFIDATAPKGIFTYTMQLKRNQPNTLVTFGTRRLTCSVIKR